MKIFLYSFLLLYTIISCSKEVKGTEHQETTFQFKIVGYFLPQHETDIWNSDTTNFGFKDENGKVKIGLKFYGYSNANKFDHIISVQEVIDSNFITYHLTKAGKVIGIDSAFLFDNTPDCESEGFIRFQDPKNQKIGMFNRNGEVVIPAEYNILTRVDNGFITGLMGAEKEHWDKDGNSGCEHYSWRGGKEVLIDTNNRVHIENFKLENSLIFRSLIITSEPITDPVRINFKGTSGLYYSFIDFNKEFSYWLKDSLLKNLSKVSLLHSSYKEIVSWRGRDLGGWINEDKSSFIDKNYELIKDKLISVNSNNVKYDIFHDELNSLIFTKEEYQKYFDNCGSSKIWIYPLMSIIITSKKFETIEQDHFDFLRTDNGYKLIQVSINTGKLK